ncbi:MAG: helix-turn-helix transcriptional regulator [Clostridia bacterium]|nr:helix-turn-helix transcriptional regulator [Clostridia bacterium]
MKRLRELREQHGYTLEQVAEALDLRNQYVSNYELGKRRPDYDTLKKFADFYQVSIDYLLEREDGEFTRVINKAKAEGVTAEDLEKALEFLRYAKERDAKS